MLRFAGSHDPIEEVISQASRITLAAIQAGWSGPPFDPFQLAEYLKIRLAPREDVSDARIVQQPKGELEIEYNPNRPKARVRYSIAHDLAHSIFPDCGEMTRYRLSRQEQKRDDWQLEMLCNLAAAEFLMPVGSFPALKEEATSIDHLVQLRARYDVSMEALLHRVVRITEQPLAVFAASRQELGALRGRYKIDYAVFSRAWRAELPSGTALPRETTVSDCTAIGFTAKRDEIWRDDLARVHVECVGIPPYPGHSYPRVVGVVSPLNKPKTSDSPKLTIVKGDAMAPRGNGEKILAHVVNDKTPLWGAGFGLAVRRQWPHVQEAFRSWAMSNRGKFRLGAVFCSQASPGLTAIQMVCQHGYGASDKPRIRYAPLQECLAQVAESALETGASIHLPKIGSGQAGGDWFFIRQLLDETVCARGVDVTVYELPGVQPNKERQPSLFDLTGGTSR